MDIEEERKAFQAALPENADWVFMDGKFAYGVIQKRFDAWLAAKVHAKETAKPTVYVRSLAEQNKLYTFAVCLIENGVYNGILQVFQTEADAKEWAISNSYRVVK